MIGRVGLYIMTYKNISLVIYYTKHSIKKPMTIVKFTEITFERVITYMYMNRMETLGKLQL